jgi:hypothetical protein
VLIVLVLLLIAVLPTWPYSSEWRTRVSAHHLLVLVLLGRI